MAIVSEAEVLVYDGRRVVLNDLFKGEPFALVFLRHLGCVFCREQVKEMTEFPNWNVAFVSMAQPEEAQEFREKMKSPHLFLCDPSAQLYDQFDVGRGSIKQVLGASNWKRGFEAMRNGAGVGAPVGDMFRLGAAFVVAEGQIVWEHHNEDASDNAGTRDIGFALERARSKIAAKGEV